MMRPPSTIALSIMALLLYSNEALQTSPTNNVVVNHRRQTTALSAFSLPPLPSLSTTASASTSVDSAWEASTLIDKYYLRRSSLNDNKLYAKLKQSKSPSAKQLLDSVGDKYTRYLDRAGYEKIQKYDLIGVGAMLVPDGGDGTIDGSKTDTPRRLLVGAPPVANSPAEAAGLKKGSVISKINNVDVSGMTSFQVIDLVNSRTDGLLDMTVDLLGPIQLARTTGAIKDPVTSSQLPNDVGYIKISEFNSLATTRTSLALRNLMAGNGGSLAGLVLDLRGNGGGSFQSAVDVAGIFVGGDRPVAKVVDANDYADGSNSNDDIVNSISGERGQLIRTKPAPSAPLDWPIVVLVDKRSASASEVLTVALRDNCKAVVGGNERSFGKGLIQAVYGLVDGGGAIVTVGEYRGIRGEAIQSTGVEPDISVSDPTKINFAKAAELEKMCIEYGK